MIEGLWSVEVISNQNVYGPGVVVFETERVFGGDAQYFYLGTYVTRGHQIEGVVRVKHFAGDVYTVFGDSADDFKLKIVGKVGRPSFDAHGYRVDNPDLKIWLRFTWRADLP